MTLEGFHAILPHVDTFLSAGLCGFQCVLASGVLFVPDTPAGGWTGEQVLGSSGHGALYILSQQDYPQAASESSASETPVVNRKEFCLRNRTASCSSKDDRLEKLTPPCAPSTTEEIDFAGAAAKFCF